MPRLKGKYCWVARQHKRGWRLGFYFHCEPVAWLPFWFASAPDIGKALDEEVPCAYIYRNAADGPTELDL